MNLEVDKIMYLISNILGTYVIYKYFSLFTDLREKKKKSIILFSTYYIIISCIFLYSSIPLLLLISNMTMFFLIGYLLNKEIKRSILCSCFIYIIFLLTEMIVTMITANIRANIQEPIIGQSLSSESTIYLSILNYFLLHLITYTMYFIINNYRELRKIYTTPIIFWICVIIVPIISIYIAIIIYDHTEVRNMFTSLAFIALFISNFATFYMFENLSAMYREKVEKYALEQQNSYYTHQLELYQTSLKSTSSFKHDLTNHLLTLQILMEKEEHEEALDYIHQMTQSSYLVKEYASSGNTIVDSIINFKFQNADKNNIRVVVLLSIPKVISIQNFDLVIILGNLLDNALEATEVLEDNKEIYIKIEENKGRLLIEIENTFDGVVVKEDNKLLSKFKNRNEHGIGMENVKNRVDNYQGIMESSYTKERFTTSILLYLIK